MTDSSKAARAIRSILPLSLWACLFAVVGPAIAATPAWAGGGWFQQATLGQPYPGFGFASVDFVDPSCGWAVGPFDGATPGLVYATTDGGVTWTRQAAAQLLDPLMAVDFLDRSRGWAVGGQLGGPTARVLTTTNGGATWTTAATVNAGSHFNDVTFVDAQRGWAIASNGVFNSIDGGATWARQSTIAESDTFYPDLWAVAFKDAAHGTAVGGLGYAFSLDYWHTPRAYETTDGGLSWTSASLPIKYGLLTDVAYTTDGVLWAVGFDSETYPLLDHTIVLRSTDGGSSWADRGSATRRNLWSLAALDGQALWAVGSSLPGVIPGAIQSTSNAGGTWTQWPNPAGSPAPSSLESVSFAGALDGWAVGDRGVVLHTDFVAPTTAAPGADGLWHRSPYVVTLIATDNPGGSGMSGGQAATEYSLDGGATWTRGTSITLGGWRRGGGSGERVVRCRSRDALGNLEEARAFTVFVDTEAPRTTDDAPLGAQSRDVTVNFTGYDAYSGVRRSFYRVDGGEWTAGSSATVPAVAGGANDGLHTIFYYSEDNAGNREIGYRVCSVTIATGGGAGAGRRQPPRRLTAPPPVR